MTPVQLSQSTGQVMRGMLKSSGTGPWNRLAGLLALLSLPACNQGPHPDQVAPLMPLLPQPFTIIDWKARSLGFDAIAFDREASGEHLPLVRMVGRGTNIDGPSFRMPSYAGGPDERTEAVTALAALVSGTLAGVDKERQHGIDWLGMAMDWYDPGIGSVVIAPGDEPGESYWYDLFACILFFQLADLHPHREDLARAMRQTAESWYHAIHALGGAEADFNHTGFLLRTMRANDNGRWREPDAAAGLAWMMHAAWQRFGDRKFLAAAIWCMDYLERWDDANGNPGYEVLLYYAPLVAARLNAEHGRGYDVDRLMAWCFSPNTERPTIRPGWGMAMDRYGEYDVHGLIGSNIDGGGYLFAMNSFHSPAIMAPLVKYDRRHARAMGRWLLNAANNARLFYPDQLPAAHQSFPDWNPDISRFFAYEGLRRTRYTLVEACSIPEIDSDGLFRVVPAGSPAWRFRLPAGTTESWISLTARPDRDLPAAAVRVEARQGSQGAWTRIGTWPSAPVQQGQQARAAFQYNTADQATPLEVRLAPGIPAGPETTIQLQAASLVTRSFVDVSPYATGDPLLYQWHDGLDIGIYGSAHAGYMGALVERTGHGNVIRFDLNATDFFADKPHPVHLYYNPGPDTATMDISPDGTRRKVIELQPDEAIVLEQVR